jgi:hypothetical protein
MELFKADMQLSKEEESEGQLEGRLARCWIITAIALFGLSGAIMVSLGADEITVSAPNERVDLAALKRPRLGGKEPSDDDYRL